MIFCARIKMAGAVAHFVKTVQECFEILALGVKFKF